jgi:hypothetical protein
LRPVIAYSWDVPFRYTKSYISPNLFFLTSMQLSIKN